MSINWQRIANLNNEGGVRNVGEWCEVEGSIFNLEKRFNSALRNIRRDGVCFPKKFLCQARRPASDRMAQTNEQAKLPMGVQSHW